MDSPGSVSTLHTDFQHPCRTGIYRTASGKVYVRETGYQRQHSTTGLQSALSHIPIRR